MPKAQKIPQPCCTCSQDTTFKWAGLNNWAGRMWPSVRSLNTLALGSRVLNVCFLLRFECTVFNDNCLINTSTVTVINAHTIFFHVVIQLLNNLAVNSLTFRFFNSLVISLVFFLLIEGICSKLCMLEEPKTMKKMMTPNPRPQFSSTRRTSSYLCLTNEYLGFSYLHLFNLNNSYDR